MSSGRGTVVASFLAVRPSGYPFRVLRTSGDRVEALKRPGDADLWINGGYFCLRKEVFGVLEPGDELVDQPFARLMARRQLHASRHNGFWAPVDTLRDLEQLERLAVSSRAPWAIWNGGRVNGGRAEAPGPPTTVEQRR